MRNYFLVLMAVFGLFSSSLKANLFEDNLRIVGESDKNSQEAKLEAIDSGRNESLNFVISKIVSKSSMPKVEELLITNPPIYFEKKFSIKKENITNKKYSADANYVFDENKIKRFLEKNGIAYTVVPLGRYIIIPTYYNKYGKKVDENIWSNYWQMLSTEDSVEFLSTFIYYDNEDIIKDKAKVADIKANLGLDDIYLLRLDSQEDGDYTLTITSATTNKSVVVKDIPSVQRATMIAPSEIEEAKKKEILSSYLSNSSEQKLRISTKNYADWVFIEKQLSALNGVTNFYVDTIGFDYITIQVKLKENMDRLKKDLQKECILFNIPSLELSRISDCS